MNIRDPWLLERTIEDCRTCYAYAQNLPRRLFDQMTLPEQWVKVKMFKKCSKMAKYQTCMDNDIKKKLEENFGPLQKLVETSQITHLPSHFSQRRPSAMPHCLRHMMRS